MESQGGGVCFDLRGSCVYTQPAFTNIGQHTTTGANVDVSERLHPAPGVEAAFRNAKRAIRFLRAARHVQTLLNQRFQILPDSANSGTRSFRARRYGMCHRVSGSHGRKGWQQSFSRRS